MDKLNESANLNIKFSKLQLDFADIHKRYVELNRSRIESIF